MTEITRKLTDYIVLWKSAASTSSFILAMVGYPEVQEKAQAEIDRVVGGNRLPTFSDKDSLPYVFAIYKETLRWHTVVPQGSLECLYAKIVVQHSFELGVPRLLQTDDIYDGYLLPGGLDIVSNTWYAISFSCLSKLRKSHLNISRGILHDPSLYPEPMVFKPERYFSSMGHSTFLQTTLKSMHLGYGRRYVLVTGLIFTRPNERDFVRICAGRHFCRKFALVVYCSDFSDYESNFEVGRARKKD